MAYFEDLTPYTYLGGSAQNTFNVGWLDSTKRFVTGYTLHKFKDRLRELCEKHTCQQTRGFHVCKLSECDRKNNTSSCEIRIKGGDKIYAAPKMIFHYVECHNYRPPDEFVDAVMTMEYPDGKDL